MIERTQAAHAAGFVSLSIGDHHDMGVPYAQNTPMLGRLLAEWPDRPAGCLFLVPLWSPLLMAEHIGTLAAIQHVAAPNAAFIVQTGLGWGGAQFTNLGADIGRRGRDIEAAIPVVKALLDGESVDSDYFGLVGARVGLRSPGTFEWWIGAGARAGIDRAARLGDAWYGSPGLTDNDLRASIDHYRASGGSRVVLRRDAVASLDSAVAATRADELIAAGYRGLSRDVLFAGAPDELAQRAIELASFGVDELVIRCADRSQADALETLTTIGEIL